MSATRIYTVQDTRAKPHATRLVRAVSKSQAIRFVAADWIAADIAGQNALVHLLSQGVHVEDASATTNTTED